MKFIKKITDIFKGRPALSMAPPIPPKDILFGILDTSNRILDPVAAGFCRNLSEFWIIEVEMRGHKVLVDADLDSLLNAAADLPSKYLVCGAIGGMYSSETEFFDQINKWISENPNFYIIGHLADRKENWFELHEQCFVINLEIFRQLGRPKFGTYQKGRFSLVEVVRSNENFHHDYTPHWLKPTSRQVSVNQVGPGFNVLNVGLLAGHMIYAFPEFIRDSKFFFHPAVKGEFSRKIVWWERQSRILLNGFYAFNTEEMKYHSSQKPPEPLSRLITLCSGLLFFETLRHIGFRAGAAVYFYDGSPTAIRFMRLIVTAWDGRDYPQFLQDHKTAESCLMNFSSPEEKWREFLERFGGEEAWLEFFQQVKENCSFHFSETDVFGERFSQQAFFKNIAPDEEVLLWLSNVFHYRFSSALRSLEERVRAQDNLLSHLQSIHPTMLIHMTPALGARVESGKVFRVQDYLEQSDFVPHFWRNTSSSYPLKIKNFSDEELAEFVGWVEHEVNVRSLLKATL